VLVVEHDEDMIRAADHVIDMGPGAGVHGGRVMAQGTAAEVEATPASVTGQYLSGTKSIAVPAKRRHALADQREPQVLRVVNATGNNLKGVSVEVPVGLLTCVTGVSGSGKSTLVNDTLYAAVAQKIYRAIPSPPRTRRSWAWSTSTRSSTSTSHPLAARRAATRPPIPGCSRPSAN
jgi:excinuclease ABC subunit A